MPSFTSSLGLHQQDIGQNDNTWGDIINQQFGLIDAAISGVTRVVLGANDYELTQNDGAEDESRAAVLDIRGNPSENLNVIVPSVSKLYIVRNGTTGERSVLIRTRLGSGVSVPQGESRQLFCDGDNVHFAAKAEDTRLVGGKEPGTVVTRDIDRRGEDGALLPESTLSVAEMDNRYIPTGSFSSVGYFTTGDVKSSIKETEAGWVRMQDGTIGPEGSGATDYEGDDAEALYKMVWDGVGNDVARVSGGRGASADADWKSGKPIKLPLALGRAIAAANSNHPLGTTDGQESMRLAVENIPEHDHWAYVYGSGSRSGAFDGYGAGAYNRDSGSDKKTSKVGKSEPFKIIGPRLYLHLLMKL